MEILAKRIKLLRLKFGLTQAALASELSIARSTLACYETNRRDVSGSVLISLAKFFEVSTDYLLGLSDI